jgi:hypothetical protein
MQTGRFSLRVVLLSSALALGGSSLAYTQAGVDAPTVNAQIDAAKADADARIKKTTNKDAQQCLSEKKAELDRLKSAVSTTADLSSLLAQVKAVSGQLDSCTAGPDGGPANGNPADGSQVTLKTDQGTPDPDALDPSVIIAPGHEASGPGVIDDGTGGPDFGGGDVGWEDNPNQNPPIIPPPPVSPTM